MRRAVGIVIVVLALGLGAAGCGSAYHRTLRDFEPDPAQRLERRIAEARHAQVTATREYRAAAAELASLIADPTLAPARLAARYERLEPADWDLRKRIASVHDVARRLPEESRDPRLGALLEALDGGAAASAAAIAAYEQRLAPEAAGAVKERSLLDLVARIEEALGALDASRHQTDAFLTGAASADGPEHAS